jgi:hypothetical protein
MTICVSVKVRDGLVLGTDSITQIWGQDQQTGNQVPIKNYANARKLFQIKDFRIGVMTYGIGNLGPRSVYGFVRDFNSRYDDAPNVESVSQALFEFVSAAYQGQFGGTEGPPLGFFVAGYSPDGDFPEEWEFQLPQDQSTHLVRPREQFGASWRGVSIPFTRLYKGFDPRAVERLKEMEVPEETMQVLEQYSSPIAYDGMPVQDAVNFAAFVLQTTIGIATFELGTPSCGGPLQVATVLPEKGFKWIREPELVAVV